MKKLVLLALLALAVPAFASVQTVQVTIGASATQVSTTLRCNWVVFQNNAAHAIRVGDSATSSTVGISVLAGGSFFAPPKPAPLVTNLSNWYIAGTQNDVIDVVCDQVNY